MIFKGSGFYETDYKKRAGGGTKTKKEPQAEAAPPADCSGAVWRRTRSDGCEISVTRDGTSKIPWSQGLIPLLRPVSPAEDLWEGWPRFSRLA